MTMKSAPYYWVECDDCGSRADDGGDYAAWDKEYGAEASAEAAEFAKLGDKWFCWDCQRKHEEEADDQA